MPVIVASPDRSAGEATAATPARAALATIEEDRAALKSAAPAREKPVNEANAEAAVSVGAAAERLISEGASRAVFVSPEGDDAAAAAVLVAREVADAGLRVILVDLTAAGAASRPMLESVSFPGITNLLASEAQFSDIIRGDLYSECHIIPVGTASPARAMRALDRLPIIPGIARHRL